MGARSGLVEFAAAGPAYACDEAVDHALARLELIERRAVSGGG